MRSGDGLRRRGGCRRRMRAPEVRRRRGIGLVRRGRDRVRGRAASNELQRVEKSSPGPEPAACAALACRGLHQWRPGLLWRPVMPLKCFFGDPWGVFGAAAASQALRNVAGWRQATCTGQIRSLCGVQAA